MKALTIGGIGIFFLVVVGAALFLLPLLTQYVWSKVVPAVIPGIVEKGYVAGTISYWVAFWMGLAPVGGIAFKLGT